MTTMLENPTTTLSHAEPAWLSALRTAARAQFEKTGYPTQKLEAWRDTNIKPIINTAFAPAPAVSDIAAADLVANFTFGDAAAAEIIFLNGHFAAHLSRLGHLPKGVTIAPLSAALSDNALQSTLARHAKIEANPFVALNSAAFQQGAVIKFARSAVCEKPIHIIYLTLESASAITTTPRTLVIMEENAEGSVVETYAGEAGTYFTNAVTEIVLSEHARLDHNKLQQESLSAYHIATQQVTLATHATFISHSTSIGSALTRNDLNVTLNGEHAEATLNGLVLIKGNQHVDNHTLLHHEKAHCPSHELYKHVLDGSATAVFKGKIFVQKDAQKTDSKQTSKTLLLSNDALMNSQPALEIYADDVKCTHGSTIGPVDEEAVFYLRSRGVSLAQARHLMTYAFAADITRRIKVAPVRARIEDFMAAQHHLPQDLRITDLGAHDLPLQ